MGKIVPLKDLDVYKLSHQLGEDAWRIVSRWKIFERDTLGNQLVRSADSVSFNICEGHGRFFYRDKRRFFFYSRGSLCEASEGIKKAYARNLINEKEYLEISNTAKDLSVKLNNFISSLNNKIKNQESESSTMRKSKV